MSRPPQATAGYRSTTVAVALLTVHLLGCGGTDPNEVLPPTLSDFEYAGVIAGYDPAHRPIATAFNPNDSHKAIRINEDLTVTDLSAGFSDGRLTDIKSDGVGNTYGRGDTLFVRAAEGPWTALTLPAREDIPSLPQSLLSYAVDGQGSLYVTAATMTTGPQLRLSLFRRSSSGAWDSIHSMLAPDTAGMSVAARKDGTIFLTATGQVTQVFASGSTTPTPLLTCRTDIIDLACQNASKAGVTATAHSNVAYAGFVDTGTTNHHPPFYVITGTTFPITTQAIIPPQQNGGTLVMTPTGNLVYYFVQQEPIDYPPYQASRAVLYRFNPTNGTFTKQVKVNIDPSISISDHEIFALNPQLQSGGIWFPGKIYHYKW